MKDYYLANRPMVTGANVLGVNCPVGELMGTNDFVNQLQTPLVGWLNAHPTKHPGYFILFLDIPSRMTETFPDIYGSVSFLLRERTPGIKPFITHINMGGTNDCRAYIDKLALMGTNYAPGKLIIGANLTGYGNTNYLVDDAAGMTQENYVTNAITGLLAYGAPSSAIIYAARGQQRLTQGTNVAGYIGWGIYEGFSPDYATDGSIQFHGQSQWYIIETIESYNGRRVPVGQGTFIEWFSAGAFGGADFSNTPVGAVTHVEEPFLPGVNDSFLYFGLWYGGRPFAIAAWVSRRTEWFQAVGDPLVKR